MKMNSFCLWLFFFLFFSVSAHQWEKFVGLTGCSLGDTNPVIPDLKEYLHHFGYLSTENHDPSKFTDSFDEDLHSALRTYQLNFNLKVTGVLDPPTIRLLMTPRCGVPDIINGTTSMLSGKLSGGRLHFSFFPGNPIWPPSRRQLTYRFLNTYPKIPGNAIKGAIAKAFGRWAAVTHFTFTEVSSGKTDMTIGFYSRDHGDGSPFDGTLNTLAHAFAPTDGRFHLDADEDWSVNSATWTARSVDLESVCVHEIGHLLGLSHSSVQNAVMYPSIGVKTIKTNLAKDDIDGIKNLYGITPLARKEGEEDPKLHVAF